MSTKRDGREVAITESLKPEAGERAWLITRLRYRVGNPSAWDNYDEEASELMRSAAEALLDIATSQVEPWVNAELLEALNRVVSIAKEAHQEWDAAPAGMRAGKILVALAGRLPGYRPDIDAVHAAIAKAEAALPSPPEVELGG